MFQYLREILFLLGPDKKRLPMLFMLFSAVSLLDLIGIGLIGPYVAVIADPSMVPSMLEKVSDWVVLPVDAENLLMVLSIALLILFAVKAVSAVTVNYLVVRFGFDQQIRLRSFLMNKYQSLDYTKYLMRNSSEYIYSINTLVGQYAGVVMKIMKTISDGFVAFAIFVLLAWVSLEVLSLLMGVSLMMVFVYDRLLRNKMRRYGRQANVAATSMLKGVNEGIEGLKEIRVLGHERYFHEQVAKGSERFAYYQSRSMVMSTVPRYLLEFVLVAFIVSLVMMAHFLREDAQQLIPILGIFGFAAIRLLPVASSSSATLIGLRFARDSVARLFRDVSESGIIFTDDLYDPNYDKGFNSLSIQDISYRYSSSGPMVLDHISMDIFAGESVGIIGASGSGKTTLIDVLLGLLVPQDGDIRFNGKSIGAVMKNWHSHVAYLPQQVFLIDDTLLRNVALGVDGDNIDSERVADALLKAQLSDLVEQLPDGVETLIGERGTRLSGGQRQRVALARAFYHGRDVLVMDEATSALDTETENEIVDEIRRLKGEKTLIIIAHRLTTVQHCDRVYKLDKGKIVASGGPDEILGSVGV